ncbi:hypothetical protein AWE51_10060 [Aquimarina aggregata]|uniref:Uncharacterized protein n=1 Tax=Aquimarina aggregata TaxID=1642818 RepID=A0A162ZRA2_9FLAO|nr:hypothetical protein [Aquimarina aggregata]KZS39975.1 hypothetical protein AWE51_10060 [Aquimarina aggregata]
MLRKRIHNKNGVVLCNQTTILIYERAIFRLLSINARLFDTCIQNNTSYAILLRSWIKECFDKNIAIEIVVKNIIKSGVVGYIESCSKTNITR